MAAEVDSAVRMSCKAHLNPSGNIYWYFKENYFYLPSWRSGTTATWAYLFKITNVNQSVIRSKIGFQYFCDFLKLNKRNLVKQILCGYFFIYFFYELFSFFNHLK